MNKTYLIIGAILLVIAVAVVVLFGSNESRNTASGVVLPQPSGDDAALKNLRVQ